MDEEASQGRQAEAGKGRKATAKEPVKKPVKETELSIQLRAAVGGLYRRFRGMRPEGALGDAAMDVLTHLHKHGPATLTALSERAHVSPASMSQTVNRLTSGGYAFRTPDPHDGRKVLFLTTPEGDAIAGATHAHRTAWLDEQLSALSAEDRAVLARAAELLRRIAES